MIAAMKDGQDYKEKIIVVVCSLVPRFLMFEWSLEALQAPRGSGILRPSSANLVDSLNKTLKQVQSIPWSRVFYIDDDHQFDGDTLLRLMEHDLDVVAAVTVKKNPPFVPVFNKSKHKNRSGKWAYTPYTWAELKGRKGLLPVVSVGRSGMLIKRGVFERLDMDFSKIWRQGQVDPYAQTSEDYDFCNRVTDDLGIQVHVDLNTTFGHIDPVAVWPYQLPDGTWTVALQWGNGDPITLMPGSPAIASAAEPTE